MNRRIQQREPTLANADRLLLVSLGFGVVFALASTGCSDEPTPKKPANETDAGKNEDAAPGHDIEAVDSGTGGGCKSDCSDGDPCTVDSCVSGACTSKPLDCGKSHACGTVSCDPKSGGCATKPVMDGSPCGDERICAGGQCVLGAAVDLAVGDGFVCLARGDGSLRCGGASGSGQLGVGSKAKGTTSLPAEAVLDVSAVRAVGAGGRHACATRGDGKTLCWGDDAWGQLGDGEPYVQQWQPSSITLDDVASLALGKHHSCALHRDGGVSCWGRVRERQYPGAGNAYPKWERQPTPFRIPTFAAIKKLAVGDHHMCALQEDGRVRCAGADLLGQCGVGDVGIGSHDGRSSVIGLVGAVDVACGADFGCALNAKSEIHCWGARAQLTGKKGDAPTATPKLLASQPDLVAVAASASGVCALSKQGELYCWGAKMQAVTTKLRFRRVAGGGDTFCGITSDGQLACWGANTFGQADIASAKAGPDIAAPTIVNLPAIKPPWCKSHTDCPDAGGCFSWTCNPGLGHCVSHLGADKTPCSDGDTCSADAACHEGRCIGKYACDDGDFCTLNKCDSASGACTFPAHLGLCDDGEACTLVSACHKGACTGVTVQCDDANACTDDSCNPKTGGCSHVANTAKTCSDGNACTTGDTCEKGACVAKGGPTSPCAEDDNPCTKAACDPHSGCVAAPVANGKPLGALQRCHDGEAVVAWGTSLAAGSDHTCALRKDGFVYCWGANDAGQRGHGKLTDAFAMTAAVEALQPAVAIAAGGKTTCAVHDDDTISCWGSNAAAQFGPANKPKSSLQPVSVAKVKNIRALAIGASHVCGAGPLGNVQCWGGSSAVWPPAPLAGGGQLALLAAGGGTTCGIASTATGPAARCWGANNVGQAGNGKASKVSKVAAVVGKLGLVQLAVGSEHTCGRSKSGALWCWGRNNYGQLGDGTTKDRLLPVRVLPAHNVVDVAAGHEHTCATTANREGWCWGRNDAGQAAAKNGAIVSTPLRHVVNQDRIALTAGRAHTCALTIADGVVCWGANDKGQLGIGVNQPAASNEPMVGTLEPASVTLCTQPSECDSKGACYATKCVLGACVAVPKADGATCNDDDACTSKDVCKSGSCGGKTCNDDNACTADACSDTGACTHSNIAAACDDGDRCVTGRVCTKGACSAGTKKTCDDGKACTIDTCNAVSGKCVHAPKTPACSGGSSVSGRVTFDWVPTWKDKGYGLNYSGLTKRPARRIVVQAIVDGVAQATAITNDNGEYRLDVPAGTKLKVRAYAWVRHHGLGPDGIGPDNCNGAHFDVEIRDNGNHNALYAMQRQDAATAPAKDFDLHAAVIHANGAYQDRTGAPFAIAWSALAAMEMVCTADPKLQAPPLQLRWSTSNVSAYHDPATDVVAMPGQQDVWTAEFNTQLVAHEMLHWLQHAFSRNDSPGGGHFVPRDVLSPSIAFAEGFADYFGGIVAGDPTVSITAGPGQQQGFATPFELPSQVESNGIDRELATAHLFYKLHTVDGGFKRPWQVAIGPLRTTPALVTAHSFAAHYNSLFGSKSKLSTLVSGAFNAPWNSLCMGGCSSPGAKPDLFDADNDIGSSYGGVRTYPAAGAPMPAEFWRLYRPLKVGLNPSTEHERLDAGGYKHHGNKWGGRRRYVLWGTGQKLLVALVNPKGWPCQDSYVSLSALWRGQAVQNTFEGDLPACPLVEFASIKGRPYVIVVERTDFAGPNPPVFAGWDIQVTAK